MLHLANSMSRSQWFGLFLGLQTLAVLGCSEKEAKPTDPQAVITGSVTNNGVNVTPETSVVFHCKDKNATASGTVDSLGKFSLTAGVTSIGIPAGRYQVMVRPPEPPAPQIGSKEYEDFMSGKVKKPEPPKDVPAVFGSFDTSGISVEVKAGDNNFDFDLAKLLKGASAEPLKPVD